MLSFMLERIKRYNVVQFMGQGHNKISQGDLVDLSGNCDLIRKLLPKIMYCFHNIL